MTTEAKTSGLTCPNCGGVVLVPEGARIVTCPFCDMRSLVQGEGGVRRWQVAAKLQRDQALDAVNGFFTGLNKARDLKRQAEVREMFLIYLPYWHVEASVAGWLFGRVKSGDDSTKPVEVEIMEDMGWNDAAVDVSEFGVHRIAVSQEALQPYDAQRLHAEGMVFEPVESPTDALKEARQHFTHRGRSKRKLKETYFERFHILRPRLSLVYYPLWVARYQYRSRSYQVVVDGVQGDVLYGKAPGNVLFRAAMLVGGMAIGNFLLVNGTIVAAQFLSSSDDDSLIVLLIPIALGAAVIAAGYRRFRYGEEVESIKERAKRAALGPFGESRGRFSSAFEMIEELSNLNTRR